MILIDVNLFLYAYDDASRQHARARAWLEEVMMGTEPIRLAWITVLGFIRLSTSPRLWTRPLTTAEASAIVRQWFSRSIVGLVEPGPRHLELLEQACAAAQARGPDITDAHLAVLAIENGATLCSTDRDFARFPKLKWLDPLTR